MSAQTKDVKAPKTERKGFDYPELNVTKYVERYAPRARIERLLLIADLVPSKASEAMFEVLKNAQHVQKDEILFPRLYSKAAGVLGDAYKDACSFNELTFEKVKHEVREANTKLDGEVQRWRNLNNNDRTRRAYIELGAHYESQGKFEPASQKYLEAFDCAETHPAQVDLRVRLCKAAILAGNFQQVRQNAHHVLDNTDYRGSMSNSQRGALMVCLGLYYLHKREYADAAFWFVQQPCRSLENELSGLITDEHIGLYGALCAVVNYNRTQFEKNVVRNKIFSNFLKRSPKALKLVQSYHNSEYSNVTKALRDIELDTRVDLYLKDQSAGVLSAVRGKAMVQFFSPFSAMGMDRMADAFGVSIKELEAELVTCISQGHINAKIDSYKKLVFAVDRDEKQELFNEVNKMGTTWLRDAQATLLRLSMIRHGVQLSQSREGVEMDEDGDASMMGLLGSAFAAFR